MAERIRLSLQQMHDPSKQRAPSLEPIQGVLEVVRRAPKTGTNKLGLLLSLLDIVPMLTRDDLTISRDVLAEQYLSIHWDHGRPYGSEPLRQSYVNKQHKDGRSTTDTIAMLQIHGLRDLLQEIGRRIVDERLQDQPLEVIDLRLSNGGEWSNEWRRCKAQAVRLIGHALWKNPVPRLQELDGRHVEFLYSRKGSEIELLPDAAEQLTKFSGVLRPLIELKFSELVARINSLSAIEFDIHSHLFGRERSMPSIEIRRGLLELQEGKCVFTNDPISVRSGSLDHVIPWSRTRLSHIENFVITTGRVNSSKADSLLGPELVDKWLGHVRRNSQAIRALAHEHHWLSGFTHVRHVALNIYRVLDPNVGVWKGRNIGVEPLEDEGKAQIIEHLKRGLGPTLDRT